MTAICLTVDLECSIGGAFQNPNFAPLCDEPIWCRISGKSHGLGFILETLASHRLTATFFVETNNVHYFHGTVVELAVQRILEAGHDIQLHAHPCWTIFKYPDWQTLSGIDRNDDFTQLSVDLSIELLNEGIATFARWGLPRPKVFRSGNLQHDDKLYRALTACGIPYSSSIGLGIYSSGLQEYSLYNGCHQLNNVLEFPVMSFIDWSLFGQSRLKSLTIAGTTFSETVSLLHALETRNLSMVVLLTHPFEFVHRKDVRFNNMRPNLHNQNRFKELCSFLSAHRDRFPTLALVDAASAFGIEEVGTQSILTTSLLQSISRKIANKIHA